MIKGFEELQVWKLAHGLALEVYRVSSAFPPEEKYCSASQIRRAASSVAANIAEGYGRHSRPEYLRFLYYSRGSLMETKSHLYLVKDLGYLNAGDADALLAKIIDLGVRLNNTISGLAKALPESMNNNRTTTE